MVSKAVTRREPHKCPPHIRQVQQEYSLWREAWELALEEACRGHLGGEEEAQFRAENPPPMFRDLLADYYASRRRQEPADLGACA